MKNRLSIKAQICLLLATAFTATLNAQTGTITGRVTDELTGASFDGVTVQVSGTDISTQSERGGRYNLTGVPTGQQQLEFTYLGFNPARETVNVVSGQVSSLDVKLDSTIYELDALEVTSQLLGRARALNFQRNEVGNATIVTADAIGLFPDQNAAEALNRLPGISVEKDQGEGRFVIIRGINPDLNSVAIDGVKLASPSADSRATLLDTIPSDTLQQLEVFKSVTPDQPGDAVGGYINIRTPSAFDQDFMVARLSLQTNYSDLVDKWENKYGATWGNTFSDGTVGLIINASYEERSLGSDNMEADPWEEEEGDDGSEGYVTSEVQLREYDLTRTRTGISANLEFKPDNFSYYYIRGSWNEYQDVEIRHRGIFENEAFTAISDDSFSTTETAFVREFKDREENMRLAAVSLGGENRFDNITVDYRLSYSLAEEDTPYDFESVYELDDDITVRFTDTTSYLPGFEQLSGPDLEDAGNYEFDGIEDASQIVEEDDLSLEMNLRVDLDNGIIQYVKAGFLGRNKEKTSDLEVFENDDNPSGVDSLAGNTHASPRDPYMSGLPYVDPGFRSGFLENISDYDMERNLGDSVIEDYTSKEDVYASYLMANMDWESSQLLFGVRFEQTDLTTDGFIYNDDDESVTSTRQEKDYSDVLPGIHYRSDLSENLVLRASANKTISRPNFGQTFPGAEVEGDEVTVGNPQLDPLEAWNLDASLEYYLPPLGLFSVSLFYKDIENFIYEQTIIQDFGDITDAEVTTFRNGPSGDIMGIEFAAQRQFDFLPDPFSGLGIYANLTLTDSKATVLGEEEGDDMRELAFIKQSDLIGNIALTYEYGKFFFRVAATYRDGYLDEVGGGAEEDRYIDDHFQTDISAHYQITQQWRFFANWLNITNEPFRAQFGETSRLSQFEEYGWSANFGVKFSY